MLIQPTTLPASGTKVGFAKWTDDAGDHTADLVVSERPAFESRWTSIMAAVDGVAELTKETPVADTVAVVPAPAGYAAVPVDLVQDGVATAFDLPARAKAQFDAGRLGPEVHITNEAVAAVTDDGMASFRTWPPS